MRIVKWATFLYKTPWQQGATSPKMLSKAPVVDEGSAEKREMTLVMVGEMLVKVVGGHQLDHQPAISIVMNIYILQS